MILSQSALENFHKHYDNAHKWTRILLLWLDLLHF